MLNFDSNDFVFKKFSNSEIVSVEKYVSDFLEKYPKTLIAVGSDSLNYKHLTIYSSIIAMFYPTISGKNEISYTKGAHLIYTKQKVKTKNKPNMWDRLWKEVQLTQTVADLIEVKIFNTDLTDTKRNIEIHVDLNTNEDFESNKLLKSTLGMFKSMGYTTKAKPDSWVASCAADLLCR